MCVCVSIYIYIYICATQTSFPQHHHHSSTSSPNKPAAAAAGGTMANTNTNLNSDDLFWHFSDQLRLQTAPSLSLGDNIWSHDVDAFLSRRRNEDPRKATLDLTSSNKNTTINSNSTSNRSSPPLLPEPKKANASFGWKNSNRSLLNKEVLKPASVGRRNLNYNEDFGGKVATFAGKKKNNNSSSNNNNNSSSSKSNSNGRGDGNGDKALDKRFKTLPAAEALPRSEAVGGYIFVCNNDTMPENLQRMLFGLPPRYRDSVRAITPGLPLFLYNYSTHQLHGIYQAASFGGTNIDPSAWEDKKCHGESRFPAQVRANTRKTYEPLEEEDFRPILHHYDGPKFRLELSVPEALALLDKFEEKDC